MTGYRTRMELSDRGKHTWATVTADLRRYVGDDCPAWGPTFMRRVVSKAYAHPGLIAVVVYRYGQWIRFRVRVPVVRQLLDLHYYGLYNWVRTRLQIEVPRTTLIGPGFRIDHYGSIIINSQSPIGANFTITHGVLVGQTDTGVPTIGDNVTVGAGAKILGRVRVGDHAVVGAAACVLHDVPECAVVAGIPARVLRVRGASDGTGENCEED